MLPYEYRRRVRRPSTAASCGRSGRRVIQRVTAGYLVDRRSSERAARLSRATPLTAQQFLRQWAPIDRAAIGAVPALRDVHAPLRRAARSQHLRPAREPAPRAVAARCAIGQGLPELGADFRAPWASAWRPARGRARRAATCPLSASASARRLHDDGRWIDQRRQRDVYAATPDRRPAVPDRRRGPGRFAAGGHDEHALRAGRVERVARLRDRRVHRDDGAGRPHRDPDRRRCAILSQRFGGAGCSTTSATPRRRSPIWYLRNDVGLGVRWLIPQLNSTVIRLDWAVPLQDGPVTRAGVRPFLGQLRAGVLIRRRLDARVCFRRVNLVVSAFAEPPRRGPTR